MAQKTMLSIEDARKRARSAFDRNWRDWACARFAGETTAAALSISLHPPRESDLRTAEQLACARAWVSEWRDCPLPGIEWQQRSWARVGNQTLPVRVRLESADDIARWAERLPLWETALARMDDVRERVNGPWRESRTRQHIEPGKQLDTPGGQTNAPDGQAGMPGALPDAPDEQPNAPDGQAGMPGASDGQMGAAVRTSINDWCELSEDDWRTSLLVWDWLFAHPHETCYVRQLPIRGIDTKWIEQHGRPLRALHRAMAGSDASFAQPDKQFRCKSCHPDTLLAGCNEFSLSTSQLSTTTIRPRVLIVCENLVNTLCLDDLPHTLAIHGSGFAVTELKSVPWIADTPLLYWGDLDSNGFAILDALRSFAPHAKSVMMDTPTLHRYFDLCVEEPRPAASSFERLTPQERKTLDLLAQGDPLRNIANLRLEQERVEWSWARTLIAEAVEEALG